MASSSSSRNWLCGDFGPGPASSSESPNCPTPPGYFRVSALGRWQCLICRHRMARIRDLRRHIVASHARINWLYEDRGEFPFFRRCLACRDQQRIRWYDDLADGMVHQQRRHPGDVEEQARRLAMAAIRARNPVSTAASCPSLNKRPRHH